ncbi:MAG: T9SS type A sorting domain-containing protein [Bacteroidota bacterium]
MKHLYIAWILLLLGSTVQAQLTLDRQVVASGGNEAQAGTYTLSQTIGEAVASPLSGGSLLFVQGFQQGYLDVINSIGPTIQVDFQVYPNPVVDYVSIRIKPESTANLVVALTDMNGRVLQTQPMAATVGNTVEATFDVSQYANGMYLLTCWQENGQVAAQQKLIKQ